MKYSGEHSCIVGLNVRAMDVDYVREYFKTHPSSTPQAFRDFVIADAMNRKLNVEEVALQYADLNKIRNIHAAQRKENDPDGSGFGFLENLAASMKRNPNINDPFLLEVSRDPPMVIVSSEERLMLSKMLSSPQFDSTESVSIDFCESQLREYSVMAVTTYSGDLRQLVPLFEIVFPKPGESADNVELGLRKIDEKMQERFGIDFESRLWTSGSANYGQWAVIRCE